MSCIIPLGRQSHKFSLASEVLRRFGKLRLRVTGSSMLPALWPGDFLLIQNARLSDVFPGDLVLFVRDGRFCVHRVTVVSRKGLSTRGDALATPDGPVAENDLLGRVAAIQRDGSLHTPVPLGPAARLLALAASHSTACCNLLLRSRSLYRRLVRVAAVAGLPVQEGECRS